ncbi:MAG: branched-chain amino acid ABC transporter permease [Planctomycetes bacterium]|jgi:branched-chain amino acid transport system permease protein|nr:branched-chain amino acid ABC transporter permease [Planctomycetota bacterium]MCL4730176.1 branched-chain amino acid ABC transporter permease [Planctomycetota bacterium]
MQLLLESGDFLARLLQQCANGVAKGSVYALVAVGYTMVYGVLQLINFAHSDVYMLGAYFSYYPARWLGYMPDGAEKPKVPLYVLGLAFAFAVTACACTGMLIERLAYRPLRNASRLAALITAIGVSIFLQNAGQMVFTSEVKSFPRYVDQTSVPLGPIAVANTSLIIVVVAALMVGGLHLFVQRTRTGAAMRACSHDMRTARLMGVNVNATISLTFAIGSAMAAVGGMLIAMDQPRLTPTMGLLMGLKAFVAAVLGGIGSIPGAALGGLLLGVAESVVGTWNTTYADAVAFVALIVVLLVKPSGILGKAGREKV